MYARKSDKHEHARTHTQSVLLFQPSQLLVYTGVCMHVCMCTLVSEALCNIKLMSEDANVRKLLYFIHVFSCFIYVSIYVSMHLCICPSICVSHSSSLSLLRCFGVAFRSRRPSGGCRHGGLTPPQPRPSDRGRLQSSVSCPPTPTPLGASACPHPARPPTTWPDLVSRQNGRQIKEMRER